MKTTGLAVVVTMVLAGALPGPVDAAACTAKSGATTAALVELYTSEGCDSCPPADRWLSATVPPGRDDGVIALAFHVDYWNQLGWPDRFASPAYTERQHTIADANGAKFVYTPQVTLQGRDYARWRNGDVKAAVAAIRDKPARATLQLDARVEGGAVRVDASAAVPAAVDRRGAVLFVALTDSALVSDVKAGENRGVRLNHDHVVRALSSSSAADAEGHAKLASTFVLPKEAGKGPTLVAVLQNPANGDVLQALELPLEACR